MEEFLSKYCENIHGSDMVQIQYKYVKELVAHYNDTVPQDIYNIILQKLVDTIDDVLLDFSEFSMTIYLKDIVLKDVHRHRNFILQIATVMKSKYQDKLKICYINNAPFVFQQIFTIINPFIDKKTKKKIIVNDANFTPVTLSNSPDSPDVSSLRETLETLPSSEYVLATAMQPNECDF